MYTKKQATQISTSRVLTGIWLLAMMFSTSSFGQSLEPVTEQLEIIPTEYFRIELILFKVLNGSNNGRLSHTISDYSDPVILEDLSGLDLNSETDKLDEEEAGTEEIEILRSEVMENAWKRLSNSRNFRPLAYQQWDELRADTVSRHAPGGIEGAAARVHGENILPDATEESSVVVAETVEYLEENILESLIEPEAVYKLDGRATLGQGRFLHIKLDFEFREVNVAALLNQSPEIAEVQFEQPVDADGILEEKTTEPLYTIFVLKKSRQILPQEPELFDNEKFGVLVYLEEVSIIEEALITPTP